MYYLIFFAQIFTFYLTSKKVNSLIYRLLRNIFGRDTSLRLFSILFLPGTFIHETSHYIFAKLLLVPVGNFNLTPEYEDRSIQMGSVSIGRTDPIRRFLIGIAPLITGVFLVMILVYFFRVSEEFWQKGIIIFLMFITANSMFSSKKDMEGAAKLFLTILIFITIFYGLGIEINLSLNESFWSTLQDYTKLTVDWMMLPLVINVFLVLISLFI